MPSLTQLTTDGHSTPTNFALVEYTEAVEQQKALDAALAAARFTGTTQDLVTGEYIVWAAGAIVGWAKTPDEAAHHAQAHVAAQAGRTTTLSTARDEFPCSIELQRAKDGTVYWTLKGYHAPGDEDAALARLQALDATLAREYRPELVPAS